MPIFIALHEWEGASGRIAPGALLDSALYDLAALSNAGLALIPYDPATAGAIAEQLALSKRLGSANKPSLTALLLSRQQYPGVGAVETLPTDETDTTKRLAPNGAGGVEWVAGGGSGGLTPTGVKTASYDAVVGDLVLLEPSNLPIVLKAPAAPTNGQRFGIVTRIGNQQPTLVTLHGNGGLFDFDNNPVAQRPLIGGGFHAVFVWDANTGRWLTESGNLDGTVVAQFCIKRSLVTGVGVSLFELDQSLLPQDANVGFRWEVDALAQKSGTDPEVADYHLRKLFQVAAGGGAVVQQRELLVDYDADPLFGPGDGSGGGIVLDINDFGTMKLVALFQQAGDALISVQGRIYADRMLDLGGG